MPSTTDGLLTTAIAGAAQIYLPRYASALSSDALETLINPPYGWSYSKIRKSALAVDNAQTNKTVTTVALREVNKPKLKKMPVSQQINNTRNGVGIELCPTCWMMSQRAAAMS